MSLEKIKESIIKDALAEANKIREDYENKSRQLLSDEEKKIDCFLKENLDKMIRAKEENKERMIFNLKSELNTKILEEKNLLLKSLFNSVGDHIAHLEEKAYLQFIEDGLRKSFTKDFNEIIFNERDKKRLNQNFINNLLKKEKFDGELKISEQTAEISGGFILKGEKVILDMSIENTISKLKEDLESEVSKILFKGF